MDDRGAGPPGSAGWIRDYSWYVLIGVRARPDGAHAGCGTGRPPSAIRRHWPRRLGGRRWRPAGRAGVRPARPPAEPADRAGEPDRSAGRPRAVLRSAWSAGRAWVVRGSGWVGLPATPDWSAGRAEPVGRSGWLAGRSRRAGFVGGRRVVSCPGWTGLPGRPNWSTGRAWVVHRRAGRGRRPGAGSRAGRGGHRSGRAGRRTGCRTVRGPVRWWHCGPAGSLPCGHGKCWRCIPPAGLIMPRQSAANSRGSAGLIRRSGDSVRDVCRTR
jgi:hypothetical protein